jgi:hypothetical protein
MVPMHSLKPPVTNDEQTLTQQGRSMRNGNGPTHCLLDLLEESRRKVLQIAAPGLPLVIGPR